MKERPSRVMSAVQPTATLHIGNYFGAIENWVRLAADHECVFAVAVYHAMTLRFDPGHLARNSIEMLIDLVACGIDPTETILFLQSDVAEHCELMWVLSCLAPLGELARMPQYREKSAALERDDGKGASAALACYPLLQAADILAYNADLVPVGRDQLKHLELARDLARSFNRRFGEFFVVPEPLLAPTPKIRSLSNPAAKMSKSLGERHYVGLFEDERSVRDKVRRAVTDAGLPTPDGEVSPGVDNLLEILRAADSAGTADQFATEVARGSASFSALKDAVADALVGLTGRLRFARKRAESSRPALLDAVRRNGDRARGMARSTLDEVRRRVGIPSLKELPYETDHKY